MNETIREFMVRACGPNDYVRLEANDCLPIYGNVEDLLNSRDRKTESRLSLWFAGFEVRADGVVNIRGSFSPIF